MEKRFPREPVEYERRVQRVFATDILGSSGDRRHRHSLSAGGGEECGVPRAAKLLLLFSITVGGSIRVSHNENDGIGYVYTTWYE